MLCRTSRSPSRPGSCSASPRVRLGQERAHTGDRRPAARCRRFRRSVVRGRDLLALPRRDLQMLRGSRIGMIFRDPLSSLHPYYTLIGSQIAETIDAHHNVDKGVARRRTGSKCSAASASRRRPSASISSTPVSGGMRQRVMIAMALILEPPLVIADEPTTALDVTVQAQIVKLLDQMRRELDTTVVMVTHDLGLSSIADHVMVMYAGRRMELGPSRVLFGAPAHPYTAGLLSLPRPPTTGQAPSWSPSRPAAEPSPQTGRLRVRAACASAMAVSPRVQRRCAVLQRRPGVRLCWLDASPRSGKRSAGPSVLAAAPARTEVVVKAEGVRLSYGGGGLLASPPCWRCLRASTIDCVAGRDARPGRRKRLRQVQPGAHHRRPHTDDRRPRDDAGTGHRDARSRPMAAMRRQVQLVFQNPFGALNPRRRVARHHRRPLPHPGVAEGADRKREVRRLMEVVGLNPEHYNRFPSEFSGGQRQRIGIARALALNPALSYPRPGLGAATASPSRPRCSISCARCRRIWASPTFSSRTTSRWFACLRPYRRHAWRHDRRARRCRDAVCHPAARHTRTLLAASVTPPPERVSGDRRLLIARRWTPHERRGRGGEPGNRAARLACPDAQAIGARSGEHGGLLVHRPARDLHVFRATHGGLDGDTPIEQYRDTGLTEMGLPVAPNGEFVFGNDQLGRDVLVRLAYGASVSLTVGVLASLAAASIGVTSASPRAIWRQDRCRAEQGHGPRDERAVPSVRPGAGLVGSSSLPLSIGVIVFFSWTTMGRVIRGQVYLVAPSGTRRGPAGRWEPGRCRSWSSTSCPTSACRSSSTPR